MNKKYLLVIYLIIAILILQTFLMYRVVDKIIELDNHIKVQEIDG